MRPCVAIFTGDGEVADPISASEAKTYTHEGVTFRMHNCVGFYPTGSTHGVSATDEGMPPLKVGSPAVAFNGYQRTEGSVTWPLGVCDGRKVEVGIRQGLSVRRLTPRECERLQGFPDDYTLVPYRKGLSAGSHRYKALGNSMAVPVMRWIGARIALVEALDEVAEEATAPEPIPSTVGAGRKWRHPNADLTIQNENNPTQPKPSRKWSRKT
jgi:hypothetical protein